MLLTGDYTRIAAVFMNAGEAMELLGIKGSGNFEQDKRLMRSLVMKYHPDRVGESREMIAVTSLIENYIRQGKPLPTIIPEREPVIRYHSYGSYGPYPSYERPKDLSRADQEFNSRAQDWWKRYIVVLLEEIDGFTERGRELSDSIQESDRDNILVECGILEDELYYIDGYIKGNATLRPDGSLIRDARSMLLGFDYARQCITNIYNIWKESKDNEDSGNLVNRSVRSGDEFNDRIRFSRNQALLLARRFGYDPDKPSTKEKISG